jgi:hypothetical protein
MSFADSRRTILSDPPRNLHAEEQTICGSTSLWCLLSFPVFLQKTWGLSVVSINIAFRPFAYNRACGFLCSNWCISGKIQTFWRQVGELSRAGSTTHMLNDSYNVQYFGNTGMCCQSLPTFGYLSTSGGWLSITGYSTLFRTDSHEYSNAGKVALGQSAIHLQWLLCNLKLKAETVILKVIRFEQICVCQDKPAWEFLRREALLKLCDLSGLHVLNQEAIS